MLAGGAMLVAGCGGSDAQNNQEAAREAAETYVQALKDGDGEAACDVLSRGAVEELETQARAGCPDALAEALGTDGDADAELDDLRVTEVNVAGRVGTATIRGGPGGEVTNQMMREGGEWRLATPGG